MLEEFISKEACDAYGCLLASSRLVWFRSWSHCLEVTRFVQVKATGIRISTQYRRTDSSSFRISMTCVFVSRTHSPSVSADQNDILNFHLCRCFVLLIQKPIHSVGQEPTFLLFSAGLDGGFQGIRKDRRLIMTCGYTNVASSSRRAVFSSSNVVRQHLCQWRQTSFPSCQCVDAQPWAPTSSDLNSFCPMVHTQSNSQLRH